MPKFARIFLPLAISLSFATVFAGEIPEAEQGGPTEPLANATHLQYLLSLDPDLDLPSSACAEVFEVAPKASDDEALALARGAFAKLKHQRLEVDQLNAAWAEFERLSVVKNVYREAFFYTLSESYSRLPQEFKNRTLVFLVLNGRNADLKTLTNSGQATEGQVLEAQNYVFGKVPPTLMRFYTDPSPDDVRLRLPQVMPFRENLADSANGLAMETRIKAKNFIAELTTRIGQGNTDTYDMQIQQQAQGLLGYPQAAVPPPDLRQTIGNQLAVHILLHATYLVRSDLESRMEMLIDAVMTPSALPKTSDDVASSKIVPYFFDMRDLYQLKPEPALQLSALGLRTKIYSNERQLVPLLRYLTLASLTLDLALQNIENFEANKAPPPPRTGEEDTDPRLKEAPPTQLEMLAKMVKTQMLPFGIVDVLLNPPANFPVMTSARVQNFLKELNRGR